MLELWHLDEAAENGDRHRQDGESDFLVLGALEVDSEVEALARQEGEGVRGIDAHRRDDREDLALEELGQPKLLLGVEVRRLDEADAVCRELRKRRLEAAVDVAHLVVRDAADGVHLALRRQAADIVVLDTALDEMLEAGDADHEELVEVGAADGDEAQALEQRVVLARRLAQYALVEAQPGALAVQVVLTVIEVHVHFLLKTGSMPKISRNSTEACAKLQRISEISYSDV